MEVDPFYPLWAEPICDWIRSVLHLPEELGHMSGDFMTPGNLTTNEDIALSFLFVIVWFVFALARRKRPFRQNLVRQCLLLVPVWLLALGVALILAALSLLPVLTLLVCMLSFPTLLLVMLIIIMRWLLRKASP